MEELNPRDPEPEAEPELDPGPGPGPGSEAALREQRELSIRQWVQAHNEHLAEEREQEERSAQERFRANRLRQAVLRERERQEGMDHMERVRQAPVPPLPFDYYLLSFFYTRNREPSSRRQPLLPTFSPFPQAAADSSLGRRRRQQTDWKKNSIFGPSDKKVKLEDLPSFNNLGEKQLDILGLLQPAVIKRVLKKLDGDDFLRMEYTCRGMRDICQEDDSWRTNIARGMFWRRDKCFVMRSPYEEIFKTLQDITALKYHLSVSYLCIWGSITNETVDLIIAAVRENGSTIKKFVIGASGYSEATDRGGAAVEATPEKLNDLAELVQATELIICAGVTCSVEMLTTARMSRVIKTLHLPARSPVDYRQLHRQKFETFTCGVAAPLDCACVIPLIQEWHKDERTINFYAVTDGTDRVLDGADVCRRMAEDINIRGGPLWHTFYSTGETEFFPVKWTDPATTNTAWMFRHEDPEKPILYLFFAQNKLLLGTCDGFKENKNHLPPSVLEKTHNTPADYASDMQTRSDFRTRSRQIARLLEHAAMVEARDQAAAAPPVAEIALDNFMEEEAGPSNEPQPEQSANTRRRHRFLSRHNRRDRDRPLSFPASQLFPAAPEVRPPVAQMRPGQRLLFRLVQAHNEEAMRPSVDDEEVAERNRLAQNNRDIDGLVNLIDMNRNGPQLPPADPAANAVNLENPEAVAGLLDPMIDVRNMWDQIYEPEGADADMEDEEEAPSEAEAREREEDQFMNP